MSESLLCSSDSQTLRCARIGGVVLGEGRVKVLSSLMPTQAEELRVLAQRYRALGADVFEWRADHQNDLTVQNVVRAAQGLEGICPQSLLFTIRTAHEGGLFAGDDALYAELIETALTQTAVKAVDIEVERSVAARLVQAAHEASKPAVMSYHDFSGTPNQGEVLARFARMHAMGGDVLKMAVMPQSEEDVLDFMSTVLRARRLFDVPILAMSMGALGRASRVCGTLFGSCATFAILEEASAPGQMAVGDVRRILHLLG